MRTVSIYDGRYTFLAEDVKYWSYAELFTAFKGMRKTKKLPLWLEGVDLFDAPRSLAVFLGSFKTFMGMCPDHVEPENTYLYLLMNNEKSFNLLLFFPHFEHGGNEGDLSAIAWFLSNLRYHYVKEGEDESGLSIWELSDVHEKLFIEIDDVVVDDIINILLHIEPGEYETLFIPIISDT